MSNYSHVCTSIYYIPKLFHKIQNLTNISSHLCSAMIDLNMRVKVEMEMEGQLRL